MQKTLAAAIIVGTCLAASASGQVVKARYSFDVNPNPFDGDNPVTLDSRTANGEGTMNGLFPGNPAEDHLYFFADAPVTYTTSSDVPPMSMFANGNDGGAVSYDLTPNATVNGAGLFFPVDIFGREFGFSGAFTVEMFFKTSGDQSNAGIQQLLLQAEGSFRYGLILNEAGPGSVRFAINDGMQIAIVDLCAQNYADGTWHYLSAEYDPSAGANGEIRVTIANEDGSADSQTTALNAQWLGLFPDGDPNMFIGMEDFNALTDGEPRRFIGLIDELQLTQGIVAPGDRLGSLPMTPSQQFPAMTGTVVRWSMDPAPGLPMPANGANPVTLDSRLGNGEGINAGQACGSPGEDHLWTFNDLPGGAYLTSSDVPPVAMFDNGFDGGSNSYDASGFATVNGALFYPQDQYGNELSFPGAFTLECFFKTSDSMNVQQILLQSDGFFRFGLSLNEDVAGNVRFAINDGVGTIPLVETGGSDNYADGEWHYVQATYDPSGSARGVVGGTLTLTITNEDGSGETVTTDIASDFPAFAGLPVGNDGNLFVGRNTFGVGDDPRTFNGLLDEVQISAGVVADSDRLGMLPASSGCPGDVNGDGSTTTADITLVVSNLGAGSPGAMGTPGDANFDGVTTTADITFVVSNLGCTTP